jgi:signal transduction histidine kinase
LACAVGWTHGHDLTAALASEVSRNLDSVAAGFAPVIRDFKSRPSGHTSDVRFEQLAQEIAAVAGATIGVRIAGPDGRLLYSSDQQPTPDVDRQPHFVVHRDDALAGLIVDSPGAATGRFLEISRRLETSDGRFAGEAMLLLDPARLLALGRDTELGPTGLIAVADLDGIVHAGYDRNHPDGSVGVGSDLTDAPDLGPGQTAVLSSGGQAGPAGRLVTMRRLSGYPLNVLIALDPDEASGSTGRYLWITVAFGIAGSGIIAVVTLILVREVWRRARREVELAYDRDRLHIARAQIAADRARMDKTDRELVASQALAEAANRARTQFLAHMSHELRTPLHAIIGFSELIQDQAPNGPGLPPIASYAADIWTSGRHLLELINTVLDISKIESGTATLSEAVVPVGELTRTSLMSVRAQAEVRNISLDLRLPDTIPAVRADRTRLLQVLINLLSNAVKFTPDNGRIVLSVAASADGELLFSVADNGIGMTEAEIEIAMEPFGQVDNALSRSFEGTGLGLPLACRLTELHGGRLELISTKGKGTTARVILPASRLLHRDAVRVEAGW